MISTSSPLHIERMTTSPSRNGGETQQVSDDTQTKKKKRPKTNRKRFRPKRPKRYNPGGLYINRDIIQVICSFLHPEILIKTASLVSSDWNAVVKDIDFWERQLEKAKEKSDFYCGELPETEAMENYSVTCLTMRSSFIRTLLSYRNPHPLIADVLYVLACSLTTNDKQLRDITRGTISVHGFLGSMGTYAICKHMRAYPISEAMGRTPLRKVLLRSMNLDGMTNNNATWSSYATVCTASWLRALNDVLQTPSQFRAKYIRAQEHLVLKQSYEQLVGSLEALEQRKEEKAKTRQEVRQKLRKLRERRK